MIDEAAAFDRVVEATRLLVVSDYDGVVAPIVADPAAARPDAAVRNALIRLSELPRTDVYLLSGRGLDSLVELFDPPDTVKLIGSHGAEGFADLDITPELQTRLQDAIASLCRIAVEFPGAAVEEKPTSVAFHVRNVAPSRRDAALGQVRTGPASAAGLNSVEGKHVIELLATDANKGEAMTRIRALSQPDCVVFIGDDVTDEHAFEVLGPLDIGLKVGPGPTAASMRVADQADVAPFLDRLAEFRATATAGEDR